MSQRYELKGKIGEGGIGTVHRAFETAQVRGARLRSQLRLRRRFGS